MCLQIMYILYTYQPYLAFDYLQWFICHKTQPNQILYI